MDGYIGDWLNLLFRWLHLITGAAWIGTSFTSTGSIKIFDRLNRPMGKAGELFAVHGGICPMCGRLLVRLRFSQKHHWFKYEAYSTWVTGVSLLAVVYYFNAKVYPIDASIMALTPIQAIGISIGFWWVGG